MILSSLIFVVSGGVTRGFGVLSLWMWAVIAPWVYLRNEGLLYGSYLLQEGDPFRFEMRGFLSLFRVLTIGWGDMFPGGSSRHVKNVGSYPGE